MLFVQPDMALRLFDSKQEVDLNQVVAGKKSAWDQFVLIYAPHLNTVVRSVLLRHGSHFLTESEDVLQEVFLRLLAKDSRLLVNFDPKRSSLKTYLSIVARSVAIDWLRKQKSDAELPHPDELRTEEKQEALTIEDLPLDSITPRQKLILQLIFEKHLEVEEIAKMLGVAAQTVRSAKHKALSKLRTEIGREV